MIADSIHIEHRNGRSSLWKIKFDEVLSCVETMVSSCESQPDSVCPNDVTSIAKSLGGDSEAFGELITKYQNKIAINIRRFSREESVVEELVHDVFVEAFLSLKSFRLKSPFINWLRKIAVRVGYRYWKQKSRRERSAGSELSNIVERAMNWDNKSDVDLRELIGWLLELMKPRDRLVLTLLYWERLSVEEAADRSGWSKTMVKVQAHRARKRLKKLFEEATK